MRKVLATGAALAVAVSVASPAEAGDDPYIFLNTQYVSASDSPLATTADDFWLEDFEDGVLDQPGVSYSAGFIRSPGSAVDSVDSDDGDVDGLGQAGRSFKALDAVSGITWSFDKTALDGLLPSQVGLVWTDGAVNETVFFEAWDAQGNSLGVLSIEGMGDNTFYGTTEDDRFFGVVWSGGISAINIRGESRSIEVDHLQFGLLVPGPGSLALLTLAGVVGRRRRRA